MTQQAIELIDELTTEDANELESLLFAESGLGRNGIERDQGWLPRLRLGPPLTNHNETMAEDADNKIEFDDLSLAEAQASDIKAGITFVGGWGASAYQYAYNDPNASRPSAVGNLVRP
jgi:hypothetical protein